MTTVPGIELWGDTCRNPTLAGHAFFLVNGTGAVGNSQAGPYRFVKVGSVPVGPHTLKPTYNHLYSRDNYRRPETLIRHEILPFDGGETPVNSCSLVSTDIKVDFGEISNVGGSQPFSIEFGNCGGANNVVDYVFSTALTFRSPRIRSDGTALRNGTCTNCAKGIQVRLKNNNGQYLDLSKKNSLADNGLAFTADGFRQSFTAELHRNPDEAQTPGAINTLLVFETVLE
ncbi:fimbrial protein [Pseudomonas sp. C2B4]|uniref:fimbrial protein n=1 Tax=Pseudomonas sp. C2B4 TaxID=2735270 RepID=UPI00158698FA|nr:fimbrial protein [Pseudomonas sp. C2B4]NUU34856.1 fimbrial protein [Pseudomonas sp. C2B4]